METSSSDGQIQEDKLMQAVDVNRFAECYEKCLNMVKHFHYKINFLMDENGYRIGVLFCSTKIIQSAFFSGLADNTVIASPQTFRAEWHLDKPWLVFIKEKVLICLQSTSL
ncbi:MULTISPECIES: hypothetical protein [Sphingobacterium]|nr:hypothetical protein [Sphingobacterium siyangense]